MTTERDPRNQITIDETDRPACSAHGAEEVHQTGESTEHGSHYVRCSICGAGRWIGI